MRAGEARKVMFGANYPMLTAAACLDGLDALGLGDEARARYLSGNARRIFTLESTG
jgi:predicted TIM-barrel fold metal-dependent hydrolase